MVRILRGGCHCGNIQVRLQTALDAAVLPLRACQCSFCRKHGAVTTSDPAGRLEVDVADASELQRYRFALGVSDFLICRQCGVFVAATTSTDAGVLGVVNANALEPREAFARQPEAMQYGDETARVREERRRRAWMPVVLREGGARG